MNWGVPRVSLNGPPRRLSLEAPPCATGTEVSPGNNDDVPEVSGVSRSTIEEAPIHDDGSTNSRGHNERREVVYLSSTAEVLFGESERSNISLDADGHLEGLFKDVTERKVSPLGDIER